jgi:hypothetical protein
MWLSNSKSCGTLIGSLCRPTLSAQLVGSYVLCVAQQFARLYFKHVIKVAKTNQHPSKRFPYLRHHPNSLSLRDSPRNPLLHYWRWNRYAIATAPALDASTVEMARSLDYVVVGVDIGMTCTGACRSQVIGPGWLFYITFATIATA